MGGSLGAFAGGGAAGYLFNKDYQAAKKAKKKNERNVRDTRQIYLDALDRAKALGAKGEAAQLQIMPLLQGSQNRALKMTGALGRSSAQGIADRSQQMMGDVQQRLASTGLYNSTGQMSAARGVNADTSRAMLELQQALAGVQSGIVQQGAGQQAQALQGLSGFYQGMSAQEAAIMQELARYMGGIQYQPGPSILGSLAGLAGAAGRGFMGMGGMGGMGGGMGGPPGMAQGYGNTYGGGYSGGGLF